MRREPPAGDAVLSEPERSTTVPSAARSSTFTPNMKLPIHGWLRFSAGYAAEWAESVISERGRGNGPCVLDPFCGSGTTLLAAERVGARAVGLEPHPFLRRVAAAKLQHGSDPGAFVTAAQQILERSASSVGDPDRYPLLIRRCFTPETLAGLDRLRRAWEQTADGSPASELCWLALTASLRPCSHVGTAPWQYVLPRKRKLRPADPRRAFENAIERMARDMRTTPTGPRATVLAADARSCEPVPDASVDLVVTSPPYPNNFDYADATRLEMTFLGEVERWADLQQVVRRHLVRSCSQHCSERELDLEAILARAELAPIATELAAVCRQLGELRKQRAGRKSYHLMIACYFLDMACTWSALRRVCRSGAELCLVLGDSAPYGVHVPVSVWMSTLARHAGFDATRFEQTRERNVKWRNRVHRVPLCEGRLWARG